MLKSAPSVEMTEMEKKPPKSVFMGGKKYLFTKNIFISALKLKCYTLFSLFSFKIGYIDNSN